ncbi:methyltransferase domain-containing protein [Rhodoblastus acidophilus]|uniref:Methyltransferase domain-containing protein n=1 Tax=Candidatus Rhodoblastus alkanivorans TaxID=2954117 RepID=A0ABS9Z463_9HYPH|nr:class I SAM-dependent methyltransferase [Candidatus Rhodoblastus alkanivorans]MCI4679208.1 methyltransferase domain-containing protein [Candidatus Rhodoblastus alkanivorans]MCI4682468.1 methyltransferase domain-containing protein [Candidatus Rhodoblastus alkanivorans]MDI4639774.1 methyltransferase domain-containing protein [Rhodoblastus acidophilus]
MEPNNAISRHYAHGSLEHAIFAALSASGKNLSALSVDDLAPVDEFHIGGRQATVDLAAQAGFARGSRLLDIGCGLGGASRYFAAELGCRVTGVDLTEEYVNVARALAERVGLAPRVSYRIGSALALPFAPQAFDGGYMLHVGMNIDDKQKLFSEARRVIAPGGIFAIYDVMREPGAGETAFPVPWASHAGMSHIESAATYRGLLEEAGFAVEKERSRADFALDVFRRMQAPAAAGGGQPSLGLHILMGATTPQKIANTIAGLEQGLIAPMEMISRVR